MSSSQATARAGANIALVKYWGKRDARLNLPAAGSLSITLAELTTRTRVIADSSLAADGLWLNGVEQPAGRVSALLDELRRRAGGGPFCRVESHNDFPTGAGLASSASGFAALVVAAAAALGLQGSSTELSELARRGSGSAARSIFGGFVKMDAGRLEDGSDAVARPLLEPEAWPLEVVVAVTDAGPKSVGSRDGMNHTMETSPYYPAWVDSVPADLEQARLAVARQDFSTLAEVAEASALKMHASMLAARPGLIYWNAASLACMHEIHRLRESGLEVFFTMDAGPQVKAVCAPGMGEEVAQHLGALAGVQQVLISGLGPGAQLQEEGR